MYHIDDAFTTQWHETEHGMPADLKQFNVHAKDPALQAVSIKIAQQIGSIGFESETWF